MINAIGLENPGIDAWIGGLPEWAALRKPVIVSVGGNSPDQYAAVVRALEAHLASAPEGTAPRIEGYELNESCPNVASGLQIGADPAATAAVVGACRAGTTRFLIAKLTPNVSDVTVAARAAVEAGADGLSLVNTFKAMVLDRETLRPFLGNRTGGLCGPAIKPIALRMVAEVAQALPGVPLVGMGGVMSGLGDHAQGDGLDGRAAEAAGAVAEERSQRLAVEHHRLEGVDQRQTVGAGLHGGAGGDGDVAHVRSELGEQEARRLRPAGADDGRRGGRIGADLQTAGHVGTGHVELVTLDARRGRLGR
jgi:hypothetical protein